MAEPTVTDLISGEAGTEDISVTAKPVRLPTAAEAFGDTAAEPQSQPYVELSTEALPTAAEAFGDPAPEQIETDALPTAAEAFGDEGEKPETLAWPTIGDDIAVAVPRTDEERELKNAQDERSGLTTILHATGQGFSDGWGEGELGLSPESEKWLREKGLITGLEASHLDSLRAINEAVIRPTAMAVEAFLRSFSSLTRGVGALGANVAEETGLAEAVGLPSSSLERELVMLSETVLLLAGATPSALGSGQSIQAARMSKRTAERLARESKRDIAELRKPGVLEEPPVPHAQRPFDDLPPADPTPVQTTATGRKSARQEAADAAAAAAAKTPEAVPEAAPAAAAKSAAAEGPKPSVATEAAPLTDKAGNINLGRIEAPDDVIDVIRNVARENDDFIGPRRGVVPLEETKELAESMGMTVRDLMKRKVGQAFNAEELTAARNLNVQAATDVVARAKVLERTIADAKAGGSAEAVAAARLDLKAAVDRHTLIQEQVAGAASESGRAQSALRITAEANRRADDIGDAAAEAAASGNLDDLAKVLAATDNAADAAAKLRKFAQTRPSDMIAEWWTNMLLSSPTTHGINLTSNIFTALSRVPTTVIAAGVGKVRGSAVGDRVMMGEVMPILQGLQSGARQGLRPAVRTFFTEASSGKFARTSKLDVRKRRAIPSYTVPGVSVKGVPLEIGGKQVRIPGRALLASDEVLKSANYAAEINAVAYRMAVKKTGKTSGAKFEAIYKSLVTKPTKQMQAMALEAAEYNTFTKKLQGWSATLTKWTTQYPALKLVAPFITTPINLMKYGSERTVFSLASKKTRDILRGKDKVAADQELAKLIMGTTVSATVVSLVMTGDMTGSGPLDYDEKRLLMATGWRPNSIKIAGQWISYDRWNPIGIVMTLTADLVTMGEHLTEEEYGEAAQRLVKLTSGFVIDQTWAKGASDLVEAIANPGTKGADYIRNMGTTFIVPQGLAAIARELDPLVRETETFMEKLRSKVPGQSDSLTPMYDVFGRTIERDKKVGDVMLSPIKVSPESTDPVFAEMKALEVYPTKVPNKIDGVELNHEEYAQYAQLSGMFLHNFLSGFVSVEGYYNIPPTIRKERFGFFVQQSRDLAKKQVRMSNRRLLTQRMENIREEQEQIQSEMDDVQETNR